MDGGVVRYRSAKALVEHLAQSAAALKVRVATAESCTGGLLAKTITDTPGASAYYAGGVVAYCDEAKASHLGVDPRNLEAYGAVSKVVALQMAFGACQRFSADVAMAVTGIAGPSGGSAEKPVGTVWFAVAQADGTGEARVERFEGGRNAVRDKSVTAVLRMAADALAWRARQGATSAP